MAKTGCSLCRKQNKLNKYIETQKAKFTQLDLHDVEMRQKLKHTKSKKGQKQLDKEMVGCLVDEGSRLALLLLVSAVVVPSVILGLLPVM